METKVTGFHKTILDNLPAGYASLRILRDDSGIISGIEILEDNKLFRELSGKQPQHVEKLHLEVVFPALFSIISETPELCCPHPENLLRSSTEFFAEKRKKWYQITLHQYASDQLVVFMNDVTAKKKAECELTNSEKRFRSLYENSTIGLYRTTPAGRIIMANPAILNILGYDSFNELALRNLEEEGFEPEYPRSVFLDEIEAKGEIKGFEARWKRKDGTPMYIRESAKSVKSDDGSILYFEGTIEDITDRKIAEIQISNLNDLFLELQVDPGENIHLIVRKASDILRGCCSFYFQKSENLPQPELKYAFQPPPQLKDKLSGLFNKITGENPGVPAEDDKNTFVSCGTAHNLCEHQEQSWLACGFGMEEGLSGILVVLFAAKRRCSATEERIISTLAKALSLEHQRYVLEKKLKESEEKYRSFVSNFHGIAFRADKNRTPLFIHGKVKEITGYSESEFISGSVTWEKIVFPEDREKYRRALQKLHSSTQLSLELDYRIVTRQKKNIWVRQHVSNIPSATGHAGAIEGVIYDISRIKKFEHNLKKAKKLAEAANESKSRFLANMSHEVRTPLHAIIGFSEILSSNEKDPGRKQMLHFIENSGNQLLYLMNDLLDLSQIESGKLRVVCSDFNPSSIASELIDFFSKKAKMKGISLNIHTNEWTDITVHSDPFKFRQILVNLVSNAIKFTEKGFVTIRMKNIIVSNNIADCIVEVEDTGIGIDPAHFHLIFEEFRQIEDYLTKKEQGAGLGLAIVKKIVTLLNGSISLNSKKGKGSLFTVKIPLQVTEAKTTQSMEQKQGIEKPAGENRIRVLLADDNEPNQFLIQSIGKRNRWDVVIVDNGKSALEAMAKGDFDLILMDIQMPLMDGYQTTHRIREKEKHTGKHIPILALTANATKSDRDKCLAAGMDDYIAKPFDRTELQNKVNVLIQK